MAGKTGMRVALAALLLLGVALAGCGPKPPCEGADVTSVRAAQDECAALTDELDAARASRAELDGELTSVRSEIRNLSGQPAALADRLHELQKGSGR
jgi:septal ring factor EnvC (AmiA/AmiB activator)